MAVRPKGRQELVDRLTSWPVGEGAIADPMKSAGRKIRPAPTGIAPVR